MHPNRIRHNWHAHGILTMFPKTEKIGEKKCLNGESNLGADRRPG